MLSDFSFGKAQRILSITDFSRIKKLGKRKTSASFILLQLANKTGKRRLGIIVTKKIGKASVRNKWKRCLREFFRQNKDIFPESMDNLFIVKRGSQFPDSFERIDKELKKLIKEK